MLTVPAYSDILLISKNYMVQGSHKLEKYLKIQDCLEKSLKLQNLKIDIKICTNVTHCMVSISYLGTMFNKKL